jgi:uncharacterized membrane protein
VRNALILLAVVAVLILVMGGLNNGTAFNVDYAVGTVNAVSVFWVSAVIAALVFIVGLVAAWFAKSATTGSRRKLEAELQATYVRLREAEALAARPAPAAPAPAVEVVAATVVAEQEAATMVETGAVTVVAGEAVTVVSDEAATAVSDEAVTTIESGETETVVADGQQAGGDAAAEPPAEEPPAGVAPGEQTAVTMAGAPPADDASPESHEGESAEAGAEADAAGRPSQSS